MIYIVIGEKSSRRGNNMATYSTMFDVYHHILLILYAILLIIINYCNIRKTLPNLILRY